MVAPQRYPAQTRVEQSEQSLDTFLAATFRHPLRIAILRAINARPGGVSYRELTQMLRPSNAQSIARHLRILRRVGAIVPHVSEDTDGISYLLAETPQAQTLRVMLGAATVSSLEERWKQADLLQTVIEATPEAIVLAGEHGEFLLVNHTAESLWGFAKPEGISTRNYADVFRCYSPEGDLLTVEEMPIPRALAGEVVIGQELTYERPDGTKLDLLCNAAPIYSSAGSANAGEQRIIGVVCAFQDITQLKALERQRDEFLSIAAHELRTPLTSILGTVQVLLRQVARASDERPVDLVGMKRGLDRVNDQSQRINKLVSDLLDTSRIQAGRLEFTMEPADMTAIVREAVDGQRMAHPGRRIIVTAPDTSTPVFGDAMRLGQVVDNLLTNALKYSADKMPVEVRLTSEEGMAHVSVRDYGDGIPQEAIPHLFERFYRAPGVEVKSESGVGLGLGLYITYTIVARHNGSIEVESTPGHGTTFHVYIPLERAESVGA